MFSLVSQKKDINILTITDILEIPEVDKGKFGEYVIQKKLPWGKMTKFG